MKKSDLTWNVVYLLLDFVMVFLAALGAYFLRFGSAIVDLKPVVYEMPLREYIYLALLFAFLIVATLAWIGLYTPRSYRRLSKEISRIFFGCTAVTMFIIVLIFLERDFFSSRFIIISSWILAIVFVTAGRIGARIVQNFLFRTGIGVNNLVIVGQTAAAHDIIRLLSTDRSFGYRIVQHFTETNSHLIHRLDSLILDMPVDEVLQVDPTAAKKDTLELLNFCNTHGIIFRYAADILNTKAANIEVDSLAGIPVIEIKRTPLDGWGRVLKRLFDILGSSVLIVLTAPIMILTAIAVKLDSSGPIMFRKLPDGSPVKRVGRNGKLFYYFKFRSMIDQAHKYRSDPRFLSRVENLREGTPMMKFSNDPRITRVGKLIRRFSLDEFPEFFLVFLGRMSLVGPRPHFPEEVERYQRHHRRALSIKPGVTGLSQISGRSDLTFEDEIRLDNYYIENWSLGLDIIILLKTPLAMIRKRKAL